MTSRQRYLLDRLIIFSRYPIPGQTKTRLIHALGAACAADLQRRLTEKTVATARALTMQQDIDLEVCFEGGSEGKMRRWLGSGEIFSPQAAGDLGKRMRAAIAQAFKSGCRRVVLIGTDIPELQNDHIRHSFQALDDHDLVLGPSTDGGYWLIGLKALGDLFQNISWGTGAVLDQTLTLAKELGLKPHLLDPLSDIDTFEDLKRWSQDEAEQRPYISVIIPALNEGDNIEASIRSALDDDAEVIVVDGGSSDNTISKATAAGARVETRPRSRAVQQNHGAALAKGRTLLFLHADTRLPDGYVGHIFEALMDTETVAGAFRFKTDWDRPIMKVAEFLTNLRSQHLKLPYGDQGLFVRKSVFEGIGGFPHVPIAEDLFLVRRLARKGRIRIVPAEVVTSARRWQTLGVFRTTLINQLIAAGCYVGVPPRLLTSLYRNKDI